MSLTEHIMSTEKRQSVLARDNNYRDNCPRTFAATQYHDQIHHILCHTCLEGRRAGYPPNAEDYLEACLWITKWDLNAAHNLVQLPLNNQHREHRGRVPPDTPSHAVDHNTRDGYTTEVDEYLMENVWNSVSAKKAVHKVDAEVLKAQLEAASDWFRGQLVARGVREGGTAVCFDNRFDPAYADRWYHPFSMGKTPSPRLPGISFVNLTNIFTKL